MKMKRTVLLTAILLMTLSGFAQRLTFEIKPYVVQKTVITEDTTFISRTDTCNKITLAIAVGEDSLEVSYDLYTTEGGGYESGKKNVPLAALDILKTKPISIPAINTLFAYWFIEAIQQL